MKIITAAVALAITAIAATSASANNWTHSPLIAGQYEGQWRSADDLQVMGYGCAFYSRVSFFTDNVKVGATKIVVDGATVFEGVSEQQDFGDKHLWMSVGHNTEATNNLADKATYNAVLDALANGKEAQLVSADGEVLGSYSLDGSKGIDRCKV